MPKAITKDAQAWLQQLATSQGWTQDAAERGDLDYYSGAVFLGEVRQHGKNEDGEAIRLPPWFAQVMEFAGEVRIASKAVSGCQQLGKSLGVSTHLAYSVIRHGYKFMYTYDSMGARNLQSTQNIKPILDAWESSIYPNHTPAQYTRNSEMWESSSGGVVQFAYSSVNKATQSRQGLAAAGGMNVGVKMDGLIDEERSQSPPGARDPFIRRLAESRLNPHPPHINNGTPGAGLGIELDFQRLDKHFAPFYDCPECGAKKPLHPKGCLLRPVVQTEGGEPVTRWFTESGKPLKWWHKDPAKPEASAYVGCSECGAELPEETRINAVYRECRLDINLAVQQVLERSLLDYLSALPAGAPLEHRSAGLWISPLLRRGNPAPTIIRQGNTSANTSDWQQQALGLTSEAAANAITLEMLRSAIGSPCPQSKPDIVLAGLDQGRQQDWLWIVRVWLPRGWRNMTAAEASEKSIRGVAFGDAINRNDLDRLLDGHGVVFGLMDSEPDISDAVAIAARTCLELADQKPRATKDVEFVERSSEGRDFELWNLRQKDFQDRVLMGFKLMGEDGRPLYRLPEKWRLWEGLIGAELSPFTHLTAMQRNPETRSWIRPADHNDDHFFAAMFFEAALSIWLQNHLGDNAGYSRVSY